MWYIVREPDSILYAVDFSVGKDSLLDGIVRKCEKLNPTLLITDSSNFLVSTRESISRRKEVLCNRILASLRQGRSKNVIIPVDSTGRVIELLYLLNSYWKQQKLSYPIIWISDIGQGVLDTAKLNLVDYMNSEINASVSRFRKNPFENLESVRIVSSLSEVDSIRGPKVILAGSSSIDRGPVIDLLHRYGVQEGHMLLLTDKTMLPNCLARKLIRTLEQKDGHSAGVVKSCSLNIPINISKSHWVYKTEEELILWKRERRERLQVEARNRRMQLQVKANDGDIAMDGMDVLEVIDTLDVRANDMINGKNQDENTRVPSSNSNTQQSQRSMVIDIDEAKTGGGLFSVFAKQSDASRMIFSAYEVERTKQWDEYGEKIDLFKVVASSDVPSGEYDNGISQKIGAGTEDNDLQDSDSEINSDNSDSDSYYDENLDEQKGNMKTDDTPRDREDGDAQSSDESVVMNLDDLEKQASKKKSSKRKKI